MLNGTAAILQSIGIVVRRRQQRRRRSRRRRRRLVGLTKLGRAKVAWIAAEAETDSDGGRGREATAPTTPQKGERASGYSSSNSDAMAAKSSTEP